MGVGVGCRSVYYLTDGYYGEPIRDYETGAVLEFSTEEGAKKYMQENEVFKRRFPDGATIHHRFAYSVWHA